MRIAFPLALLLSIAASGQIEAPAQTAAAISSSANPEVLHIGGAVLAPKLIFQVDPEIGEEARKSHRSVHAAVAVWIGPDGIPSHLRLLQRTNLGPESDQRILNAVSRYRYKPATLNGKPITVDTQVDIFMDIF